MITPYRIFLAIIAAIAFMLLLMPGIFYYDTPTFSSQLNATGYNATASLNSQIINPLNSTAFGGSTHNSGLFAQVTVFTGLAFVFDGFGYVMLTLLNAPRLIVYLISTPLSMLGFAVYTISIMVSLLVGIILFILIIEAVSAWMKYQIRGYN